MRPISKDSYVFHALSFKYHVSRLARASDCRRSLRRKNSDSADLHRPGRRLELACPTAMVREATTPQGTDVHFDAPTPTGGRRRTTSSATRVRQRLSRRRNDRAMHGDGCRHGAGGVRLRGHGARIADDRADEVHGLRRQHHRRRDVAGSARSCSGRPRLIHSSSSRCCSSGTRRNRSSSRITGVGGERTNQGVTASSCGTRRGATRSAAAARRESMRFGRLPTATQEQHCETMITDARPREVTSSSRRSCRCCRVEALQPASEHMPAIRALNSRIFAARRPNTISGHVVDLFALFDANMHLLGADGLHPRSKARPASPKPSGTKSSAVMTAVRQRRHSVSRP